MCYQNIRNTDEPISVKKTWRNTAMKILIFTNDSGGLFNFRREVLQEMLNSGHEVYICLPNGSFIPELTQTGCIFEPYAFDRHGTNPFDELRMIRDYKRIIEKVSPDIVFTYTIKPNIYGGIACIKTRIPYVANITGLGLAIENGGVLQKITLALYKLGLRRAQKVFFQNTENRDFMLKHGILKGAYDLLPGSGVNLRHFSALDYPSAERTEFAFISRIMKEKGADQYLEAAEYIKSRYPNTIFHVCGSCEQDYEERLKELYEKGIIIYHGVVKDVREVLKNVHCTVHPTYYPEGMSNVLLESSACARPIITTDRAGCREIIDDRVNGYIVKQRDSKDLIEKIERFLALPWEEKRRMGCYGRKKVEQSFDRNIVVWQYLRELEEIQSTGD